MTSVPIGLFSSQRAIVVQVIAPIRCVFHIGGFATQGWQLDEHIKHMNDGFDKERHYITKLANAPGQFYTQSFKDW